MTRFWELGFGCLIATLTVRRPARTARSERIAAVVAVVVAVALIIAALVELNPTSVYPGALAWLPCAGAGLLVWAGIGGVRNPVTRLLATRPLGYIGDISYSLYLAHYVWLVLPEQLASPLTSWPWRLLELAGTFVTAALSYHFLENPIRRSRRLAGDRVAVFLLLCVCVATTWTASIIVGHFVQLT